MVKRVLTLTLLASISLACVHAPAPCGPVPTAPQLEWKKMERQSYTMDVLENHLIIVSMLV